MSVIDDLFRTSVGEPARLDYIIREHDKLKKRVEALEYFLISKGLLTRDERAHLAEITRRSDESGD